MVMTGHQPVFNRCLVTVLNIYECGVTAFDMVTLEWSPKQLQRILWTFLGSRSDALNGHSFTCSNSDPI